MEVVGGSSKFKTRSLKEIVTPIKAILSVCCFVWKSQWRGVVGVVLVLDKSKNDEGCHKSRTFFSLFHFFILGLG